MGCSKETDQSDLTATKQKNPPPAQNNQEHSDDPVNLVTGAFTLDEQDLSFSTQRLVLELTRYYDSQQHSESGKMGAFGWGWTHSLNLYIEDGPEENEYSYVDDRGAKITFKIDPESGDFISPPGALGLKLSRTDDGGFRLRQIDGLIAEFNTEGKIIAMIRPGLAADSRIDFTYDGLGRLAEAQGAGSRGIKFQYKGKSPLVRVVVDHTGRKWRYFYDRYNQLVKVVDPAGRIRRYSYTYQPVQITNEAGALERREVRGLHQVFKYAPGEDTEPVVEVTNYYTSANRVYEQVDAQGNVTRFDYNRFTRMTYMTDPAGWTTVYGYDQSGNTTKVRMPEGGTTEYIYDEGRNLLVEIDPLGHRTEYAELKDSSILDREMEFGHRALGNRSDYVTISSDQVAVGYDKYGNRSMMRDALGNTSRYLDYTDFGHPRRVILPTGNEIHYEYDERSGLPVRMEQELTIGRSEPMRLIREWTYDPLGNVIRHVEWVESRDGKINDKRVTTQTYDKHGHQPISKLTWIENDDESGTFPGEEQFEWDELGRLTAHKILRRTSADADPEELITRFGYDVLGRKIWEIASDGTAFCAELDLEGRIVESFLVKNVTPKLLANVPEQERQMRERWAYDLLGNVIEYVDSTGAKTISEWNERGLCTRVIEPTGHTTDYEYDRDGREIAQRTSAGYEIHSTYDLAGRMIAQKDNAGLEMNWEYDALGRMVKATQITEDMTSEMLYGYDELGRLIETNYPDGAYERLAYDERHNLIRREKGPEPVYVEVYTYDGLGRPMEIRAGAENELKTQFAYRYDDAQRLVETYDALGNVTREFHDTTGNLIRRVDAEGRALHLIYDEKGRLTRRKAADQSADAQLVYDFADRLIGAKEGPIVYRWDYDEAGQVTHHHQKLGQATKMVSYRYDQIGRLIQKQLDNRWWMKFDYAEASPFISQIRLPGHTIDVETDAQGRITEERWAGGNRTRYEYQPDGVLKKLTFLDEQRRLIFGQQFTHDARRRPITEIRHQPGQEIHYRNYYDKSDRLARVDRGTASGLNEFRRYTYDTLGNRLSEYRDGLPYQTWRYDTANRIVQVKDNDKSIPYEHDRCGNLIRYGERQFVYDASQRLQQVSQYGVSKPLAKYFYSATNQRVLIERSKGVEQVIYDGVQEIASESSVGQWTAYWGIQPDSLVAFSTTERRKPEMIFVDMQYSPVSIGKSRQLTNYDPFGVQIQKTGTGLPFGFAGKRYDPESGFYNNRIRLYDPFSGRFTQPDPLGIVDGLNLYQYARSNPLVYGDPSGFTSVKTAKGSISQSNNKTLLLPEASPGVYLQPLDQLGRPTLAQAVITKEMIMTGTGAKQSIRPSGFGGQDAKHQRGHLIAKELGGSGSDPQNLATMYNNANQLKSAMRHWEKQTRGLAEQGHTVYYNVRPIYKGSSSIARGFSISISVQGKTVGHGTVRNIQLPK